MLNVPGALARKEDTMGQEDIAGLDFSKPEDVQKIMEIVTAKIKQSIHNEPYIKEVLKGNFMEMVRRGHFKLE